MIQGLIVLGGALVILLLSISLAIYCSFCCCTKITLKGTVRKVFRLVFKTIFWVTVVILAAYFVFASGIYEWIVIQSGLGMPMIQLVPNRR